MRGFDNFVCGGRADAFDDLHIDRAGTASQDVALIVTEDEINIMARCKEDEMFFFFLDGYPTEMERSVVNSSITDPCPLRSKRDAVFSTAYGLDKLALRSWHGDPLISLPIKPFYEAINAISAISLNVAVRLSAITGPSK
ncbi:hypothetical protein CCM_07535 [Cordyceps militaris CM01]|uniref:Uncharacterized protein n=1 Tax=Cordyceps militaris (strain CM01) TaxID=983644 RepID=G3JQ32_CORMM|nr:uncharacterized protein CCM_07535 [Cordyceps militaris CM01]EGX89283.1 hypothetical protein CCM_07535 [Cordyceps militaris CM01]